MQKFNPNFIHPNDPFIAMTPENSPNKKISLFRILLLLLIVLTLFFAFYFILRYVSDKKNNNQVNDLVDLEIDLESENQVQDESEDLAFDAKEEIRTFSTLSNSTLNYSFKYPDNTGLKPVYCSEYGSQNSSEKTRVIFYNELENDNNDPASQCEIQGAGVITISKQNDYSDCTSSESWEVESSPIYVDRVELQKCESTFIGEKMYPGPDKRSYVLIPRKNDYIRVELNDFNFEYVYIDIVSTFKNIEN